MTSDTPNQHYPAENPAMSVDTVKMPAIPEPLVADLIVAAALVPQIETPHRLSRAWRWTADALETLFGAATLFVALAVLAATPIANLLALGYLFESSGRVVRSGRLRDGLIGARKAARVGSIVLGTWLCLLPLRAVSNVWQAAYLIDPASEATRNWRGVLVTLTVVMLVHILWAWQRGGRLRHFVWPAPVRFARWLFRGGKYVAARDAVWEFVAGLRLPYYFSLGLRGFLGSAAWLVVPVTMLALATLWANAAGAIVGLIGGLLLTIVVVYLPVMQARFAASGKWGDLFAMREARHTFHKAPIVILLAVVVLLAGAMPLYVLKIELLPHEVTWLPSLLFVATIWPARLAVAWAVSRAARREHVRSWPVRWGARLALVPVAIAFVGLVYLSPTLLWNGVWSMYEQHAFLTPAPF